MWSKLDFFVNGVWKIEEMSGKPLSHHEKYVIYCRLDRRDWVVKGGFAP